MTAIALDDLDRRILECIQAEFPIDRRPFQTLADQLASTEQEVLARVRRLSEAGVIRRLGPVFNIRGLGFASTLCAASVDPASVDDVAAAINAHEETTHNYLREHAFNMWFTLVAPSRERIDTILDSIRPLPGVQRLISLPAEKMFKINVHFSMVQDNETTD